MNINEQWEAFIKSSGADFVRFVDTSSLPGEFTAEYGCAVVLGKVLTAAPFVAAPAQPIEPQCGDCNVCVDVCPTKALSGKPWELGAPARTYCIRKLCSPCMKCLVHCPYTIRYAEGGAGQ